MEEIFVFQTRVFKFLANMECKCYSKVKKKFSLKISKVMPGRQKNSVTWGDYHYSHRAVFDGTSLISHSFAKDHIINLIFI